MLKWHAFTYISKEKLAGQGKKKKKNNICNLNKQRNQVGCHTGRPKAIASIVTLPNVSPSPCTQFYIVNSV